MSLGFLIALSPLVLLLLGPAAGAPQQGPPRVGIENGHIPIVYEAYYPEPAKPSGLVELEKLEQLTRQLLEQEKRLEGLSEPENVLEPRSQLLEYVFSGTRPSAGDEHQVRVTSLTVSDVGPPAPPQLHKTRHHHGQADWLLRRLRG